MRKRLTGLVLGGALALGVTGAVVVPAVASAATSETDTATAITDRVAAIREALAGLVSDNTITQEQADRVAETLAEELPSHRHGHGHGHGGFGRGLGLGTAAEALGMTEDELREALVDGDTLAEVAEQEGVAVDAVVDALVAEARERLAQAVEDGDLTQAEADEMAADLEARIAERVEEGGFVHHRGPRGHGPRGLEGNVPDADADAATPTPQADVEGSSTRADRTSGVTVAA